MPAPRGVGVGTTRSTGKDLFPGHPLCYAEPVDMATHVWCDSCQEIRPIAEEGLAYPDATGHYLSADLICAVCGGIVCTLYTPLQDLAQAES